MVISGFNTNAAIVAEGDDCGDDCHWAYDDETKTLSFKGKGTMYHYTTDQQNHDIAGMKWWTERPWVDYISLVENLTVSDGFTMLPMYLCTDCINLKSISLPDTLESISVCSFLNTALTDVIIPSSVTYVSNEAFLGTSSLKTLYCTKAQAKQCAAAAELSYSGVIPAIYEQTSDGNYKVGSKIYNSLNDMQSGNNVKFRIYTIEEANAVAGKVNSVKIRYR